MDKKQACEDDWRPWPLRICSNVGTSLSKTDQYPRISEKRLSQNFSSRAGITESDHLLLSTPTAENTSAR